MTAPKQTYKGWPNRETWNVMLWMNNDEGAYRAYRVEVRKSKQEKRYFSGADAERVCRAAFGSATPDRVDFDSTKIRWGKIAEAMREES